MKVKEVIDEIFHFHPDIGDMQTCDTLKCGDPDMVVTGIATTCSPTAEVIQKAAALGCNMLICHEPLFYSHMDKTDWLENDSVYQKKMALLSKHQIAVFRNYDHLHAHDPDGIYYGVMMELGWEPYRDDDGRRPKLFSLPKQPLSSLMDHLKERLSLSTLRLIGKTDGEISKVIYLGGGNMSLQPTEYDTTKLMMETNADLLIAGELIDWTVMSYVRDAALLGEQKTIIQLGHFNSEELGMKYFCNWLKLLVDENLPVIHIPSGDPYQYR